MKSMKLENKVAIVTGGASGIGAATVIKMIEEGARVALFDIQEVKDEKLQRVMAMNGAAAALIPCDVSDEQAVRAAVEKVVSLWGGIDILFNNAGIAFFNPIEKISIEEFQGVVDVNFKSVFLTIRAVLPHMRAAGKGSIISTSSTNAILPTTLLSVYAGTKAAVIAFSRAVAAECAHENIRVNCIAPGGVDTPINSKIFLQAGHGDLEAGKRVMGKAHPMLRIAAPEEIANAVLFLASDDASFCTAAVLSVDGGLTGIWGSPAAQSSARSNPQ